MLKLFPEYTFNASGDRLLMIKLITQTAMNFFSGLVCQEEGGGYAVSRVPHAVSSTATEPALQCYPEPYT